MFAQTPNPPYTAVIFTSCLSDDIEGYDIAAAEMVRLAQEQEGYLGIESAREKIGITVSYWCDESCAKEWKQNVDHALVQRIGAERWYRQYRVRIAIVTRDY
ncbi:MAG: antibiotic biosynthesis monooxygenase [Actinomycetota bacterium]|nr:antibiotic biosynthesis monooxygenase [Actinomycetota bacterium]